MVMTSDAVRHELSRIEALIELNSAATANDWLEEQRTYLRALLSARRAQGGKILVSLAIWRDGASDCVGRSIAEAA